MTNHPNRSQTPTSIDGYTLHRIDATVYVDGFQDKTHSGRRYIARDAEGTIYKVDPSGGVLPNDRYVYSPEYRMLRREGCETETGIRIPASQARRLGLI
jgi:hypothetical protein